MKSLLSVFFLLVFSFGAGAQVRCQVLYGKKNAQELIESLNDQYSKILFPSSLTEGIDQSFLPLKKIKLMRLKSMLKDLNKNAGGFDAFDLSSFVFRLDRLAFAELAETDPELQSKLSPHDKLVLSETRRTLLADGIAKNFNITDSNSGFWRKTYSVITTMVSWKYWRWTKSPTWMPNLVGLALPVELAQKIAWEGLDAHRMEVEKYLPQIKNRSVFNRFSKVYNSLILASLLTVVPYFGMDYYHQKIAEGQVVTEQIFKPLVDTSAEMAQVDRAMEQELGSLEKYKKNFAIIHKRPATDEELQAAQQIIHQKILDQLASNPE